MPRSERYSGILPIATLENTSCTIVGIGAIGRQVSICLAAQGVKKLQLIDFDIVEDLNLGPQAFFTQDIGKFKVEQTGELLKLFNPEIELTLINEKYAKELELNPIVFSCVDCMDTRQLIYNNIKDKVELFIDTRMAAETCRIITLTKDSKYDYKDTLFDPEDGVPESCTARSTIYCAYMAAAHAIRQYSIWLRGITPAFDFMHDLYGNSIENPQSKENLAWANL